MPRWHFMGTTTMERSREEQLEEEVELLRQQLGAVTGSSQELGALLSLKHGMTDRLATMLYMLVKRSPAVISRGTFHSIIFGHDSDGGPEPKIFAVYISRLRSILRELKCPGRIDTVWSAGYKATPELVKWVEDLFAKAGIKKEK